MAALPWREGRGGSDHGAHGRPFRQPTRRGGQEADGAAAAISFALGRPIDRY
jgi:hypothetical protein